MTHLEKAWLLRKSHSHVRCTITTLLYYHTHQIKKHEYIT